MRAHPAHMSAPLRTSILAASLCNPLIESLQPCHSLQNACMILHASYKVAAFSTTILCTNAWIQACCRPNSATGTHALLYSQWLTNSIRHSPAHPGRFWKRSSRKALQQSGDAFFPSALSNGLPEGCTGLACVEHMQSGQIIWMLSWCASAQMC